MSDLRDSLWATKQIDLVSLIGAHTRLKKVSAHEYAGPCPRCGGTDRFRVNDQRGFFCRQCQGPDKWHDAIDFRMWFTGETFRQAVQSLIGNRGIDPAELAKIAAEREARDAAYKAAELAKQLEARATIQHAETWKAYYPGGRELWRARGISDDWQDYYKVGYCKSREWVSGDTRFISDSLTIPYFHYTTPGEFECVSIKHRLLLEDAPGGKYRPEMAGLGNQLYFPWYEERMNRDVLIVEGEIKAMVVHAALWIGKDPIAPCLSVVGIAGAGFRPEHLQEFANCERAWFIKDPDTVKSKGAETRAAKSMVEQFSGRLTVVSLPEKVDDLITKNILDGFDLLQLLKGYA